MIELVMAIVMIGVVLDVTGMMWLEMPMDDLGVLAALGFADVHVLRRQQRQAEQAEHGGDGDRAPERHCVDYPWRSRARQFCRDSDDKVRELSGSARLD